MLECRPHSGPTVLKSTLIEKYGEGSKRNRHLQEDIFLHTYLAFWEGVLDDRPVVRESRPAALSDGAARIYSNA